MIKINGVTCDNDKTVVFKCDKRKKYVTIPDSVTKIIDGAFWGCRNLESITIPNSVTSIGNYAFAYCNSLTSITIPNSVTSIGICAFECCSSLTSITISDSVASIGYRTFSDCTNLTSITIPDSVTYLGDQAFNSCTNLASITIPDSVTSIGDYAFCNCSSLTSIRIPDSVTKIGDCAFWDCSSLTSTPNNYEAFSIKNNKFYCQNVQFKENEWSEEINNLKLWERGYHYCTNLFEIFDYYCGEIDKDIAIFEVETGDKVEKSDTSKCVTNKVKPVKRLYRKDVIRILNNKGE